MGDECTDFLDQLEVFLDGECGEDMKARVAQHMEDCPPCEHRADFEDRLRRIVAASCRDSAPPGLVDAVLSRLQLG